MIGLTFFKCPNCKKRYEANYYDLKKPPAGRSAFHCVGCGRVVASWSGTRQYANFWPLKGAAALVRAGVSWPLPIETVALQGKEGGESAVLCRKGV